MNVWGDECRGDECWTIVEFNEHKALRRRIKCRKCFSMASLQFLSAWTPWRLVGGWSAVSDIWMIGWMLSWPMHAVIFQLHVEKFSTLSPYVLHAHMVKMLRWFLLHERLTFWGNMFCMLPYSNVYTTEVNPSLSKQCPQTSLVETVSTEGLLLNWSQSRLPSPTYLPPPTMQTLCWSRHVMYSTLLRLRLRCSKWVLKGTLWWGRHGVNALCVSDW